MRREMYDLYGNSLENSADLEEIAYVVCDCGHWAIRQKMQLGLFRCSLCTKEYVRTKDGKLANRKNKRTR